MVAFLPNRRKYCALSQNHFMEPSERLWRLKIGKKGVCR